MRCWHPPRLHVELLMRKYGEVLVLGVDSVHRHGGVDALGPRDDPSIHVDQPHWVDPRLG